MAPDMAFEVIQTLEGDSIFFSIGTDHVFYVTREIRETQTGWSRVDLSSTLSSQHGNAAVTAKSFSISQNAQTMQFDAALIITVTGADFLYLSLNHPNTADAWANGVTWTVIPFDAANITVPKPLTIADVYLMNIPSTDGSNPVQNCFVDIMRTAGDPLALLDRYYITPGSTPQWAKHTLAIDLKAASISSCLGHRTNDYVPGIYTFGTIGTTRELIYAPQYNFFRPAVAPLASRLTLPAGATAISSALNGNGDTNLFVAGTGGIYVFTPDNQGDGSSPVLAVPSSTLAQINILAGVSELSASTTSSRTVVWALNAQGSLVHTYCPAGQEATASAWSTPIPLCSGVEGFAFYLNMAASNNVLFAHLSGAQLLQLTQDPLTGTWSQRNILLPATAINDMIEFNSFTTHISIYDANGLPVTNTPVTLTSTSPVTVYINNVYHVLTPTIPINATSDFSGSVTVVQETQSLNAVCFEITVTGPPSVTAQVDPLAKASQTLASIQQGSDLRAVQIKDTTGAAQPLIPSTVPSTTSDAAAKSIANLWKIKATLPADGSVKTTAPATAVSHVASSTTASIKPPLVWGVSFVNGATYHEGEEAVSQHIRTKAVANTAPVHTVGLSLAQQIEVAAGDLFNFLQSAWADVSSFVVQQAGAVYHFLATIGGKIYDAILDSVAVVTGAIEFVLNQIEVAFEKLVAWLGFLFDWDDIKRTHLVLKNVMKQFGNKVISSMDTLETMVENAFVNLENEINSFTGITDPGELIGTRQQAASATPGVNSPQSNWAVQHTNNGMGDAQTTYVGSNSSSPGLDQLMADLQGLVTNEEDYISTTVTQIKTQVIDQISSMTPLEAIKKILGIVSDLILKSARNIIVKLIDVIKLMISELLVMLDAPINIPIISPMYKAITGSDLSVLDLIAFVGAIPATIMYKLAAGQAPFPDNATTNELIAAPDFATLSSLITGSSAPAAAQTKLVSGIHSEMKSTAVSKWVPDAGIQNIFAIIMNFAAVTGSILVVACAVKKREQPTPPSAETTTIRAIAATSYLLFISPDIAGAFSNGAEWYVIMNDIITIIATGKTLFDNTEFLSEDDTWNNKISPILETIINICWLPTAIGAIPTMIHEGKTPAATDWIGLVANLFFDGGGALTAGTSEELAPVPVAEGLFAASQVCNLMYGLLCGICASMSVPS
ncbi:hypothetical protein L207DRAFT_517206 [Hyaloscypha variabilis F]|uniref:Uncharacterized protein n=1 Tax=Hyaloscypha variabilis (strain UAMH 11265 / GT02V1 / F) TaxID=1149755 RepID=A0A2J6R994_HYAVF|nr:hypothetical protein L207DRAFT_517206 [Hyaloscypha variabilis F]